MSVHNSSKKILCLFVVSLSLFACTPTTAQRGNLLEDYQMAEIQTGISTQSDVLRLLGSPTTQAPFHENIWYYIGQETQKKGIFDEEVKRERIIVVTFNDAGIVDQFGEVDRERIDIPYVRDATPTLGNETTIAREFFGNIGRFNTPTNEE